MEVSQIDHSAVGHAISTKRVGSNFLEDVTHLYKYQDGNSVLIKSRYHLEFYNENQGIEILKNVYVLEAKIINVIIE